MVKPTLVSRCGPCRTVPTSRLTQGATAQSVLVQVEKAPPDAPYRDPHGLPDLRPR